MRILGSYKGVRVVPSLPATFLPPSPGTKESAPAKTCQRLCLHVPSWCGVVLQPFWHSVTCSVSQEYLLCVCAVVTECHHSLPLPFCTWIWILWSGSRAWECCSTPAAWDWVSTHAVGMWWQSIVLSGAQSCRRQWHKARAPAAPRLSHSAADCTALDLEAALGDPRRNINTNRPGFLSVGSCASLPEHPRLSLHWGVQARCSCKSLVGTRCPPKCLLCPCQDPVTLTTGAEAGAGQGMVGRLDQAAELEELVSHVESREQKAQWRLVLQQKMFQG